MVSTVPAPMRQSGRRLAARAAMLANGSGEFSGTSIMRMPALQSTSAIPTTRPGSTPRRIATRACSPLGSSAGCIRHQAGGQLSMYLHESGERCRGTVEAACGVILRREARCIELREMRRANQMHAAYAGCLRQHGQCTAYIACNQQTGQVSGGGLWQQIAVEAASATLE